jgi:general secretion pathway protein K
MSRAEGTGGYATLAVLVFAGFLAAVCIGLLQAPRPTLARAELAIDSVQVDVLLQSGVQLAGFRLYSAHAGERPSEGARQLVGGHVAFRAVSEAGRLALNAADPEMIQGLVEELGLRSVDARAFAEAVVLLRGDGAGEEEGGAGPDERQPIVSLGALAGLAGLSDDDLQTLARHVSLHGDDPRIDVMAASPEVLGAVPDMGPGDRERLLRLRQGQRSGAALDTLLADHAAYVMAGEADIYRIAVDAMTERGMRARAEAIIAPSDGAADSPPFLVLAYSRAASDQFGKGGR